MGDDEPQESAVVNAIERLIDAKLWLEKTDNYDTVQLFHAGNEYNGAKNELTKLLEETKLSKEDK